MAYKLILSAKLPYINDNDEMEMKDYKFFFGIDLLYPLKHEYGLDIPDFQKFMPKKDKKKEASLDQIEFIMKFLHSAHLSYCNIKGVDESLRFRQLFMAFDGEYQETLLKLMTDGMGVLMDSMGSEENPKTPSQPNR